MTTEILRQIPQTMPLHGTSLQAHRGWRWFNHVVAQCALPARRRKPRWVHLPDRVWQRQSALLVSLHELKRDQ